MILFLFMKQYTHSEPPDKVVKYKIIKFQGLMDGFNE
jgi:hypothetical protein